MKLILFDGSFLPEGLQGQWGCKIPLFCGWRKIKTLIRPLGFRFLEPVLSLWIHQGPKSGFQLIILNSNQQALFDMLFQDLRKNQTLKT